MSLAPSSQDPAAQAFERLQGEVLLLRHAVQDMAAEGRRDRTDYSPTLGKLLKSVSVVEARLEELGANGWLAMTQEQIASLVAIAAAAANRQSLAELRQDRELLRGVALKLHATFDASAARRARWRFAAFAGLGGLIMGAMLWAAVLGPIARLLPATWQIPERLAAATLGAPRALAGERLLANADPARWRRLRVGDLLSPREAEQLKDCIRRAAAKTEGSVRCEVSLSSRRPLLDVAL